MDNECMYRHTYGEWVPLGRGCLDEQAGKASEGGHLSPQGGSALGTRRLEPEGRWDDFPLLFGLEEMAGVSPFSPP